MVKLGISGLGFVGNSMLESFLKKELNVIGYDKYKDMGVNKLDDLLNVDIIFLALPTKFDENTQTYDISQIIDSCEFLNSEKYNGLVVIKSTVLPGTTKNLSEKFTNLNFVHNPEFLSAKTAFEDFHNQNHVVLGTTKKCNIDKYLQLKNIFSSNYKCTISECTSNESETMKCFANSFYAVKIQFFTEMYLTCKFNESNYECVKDMMLKNGWINPMHTNVPGSDGKISYGGYCFPKDTMALNNYMKKHKIPNSVLNSTILERDSIRDDSSNILNKNNESNFNINI